MMTLVAVAMVATEKRGNCYDDIGHWWLLRWWGSCGTNNFGRHVKNRMNKAGYITTSNAGGQGHY